MNLILKTVLGLIVYLPDWFTFGLARVVGYWFYFLSGKRRRIALDNLRAAYGNEKSEAELRWIARRSFAHMILTMVEFVRVVNHRKDVSRLISVTGQHWLDEALAKGKGAIGLTCHLGNWEIGAATFSLVLGRHVAIAARRPSVKAVADFLTHLRSSVGVEEIDRNRGMMRILRRLKEGYCVPLALDQFASKNCVVVPFFGRPANTFTTPALLTIREGIPVVTVYMIRLTSTNMQINFLPEILPDESGQTEDERVERTTARYSALLEDLIRQHPDQWLWMHRRWR